MTYSAVVEPTHPALPGHFPGNPIVPGVVLLQHVFDAASREGFRVVALASAKFLAPLRPGESFDIAFETKNTRLQFLVHREKELLAQGSLDVEPLHP